VLYIVCYDIADDRRREHMARALLDYGSRIQESVFAAHLDEELFGRMVGRVEKILDPALDRVHVLRLCKTCEDSLIAMGLAGVKRDADYWVL
jgi:CRISPR-associated protein Cas2